MMIPASQTVYTIPGVVHIEVLSDKSVSPVTSQAATQATLIA